MCVAPNEGLSFLNAFLHTGNTHLGWGDGWRVQETTQDISDGRWSYWLIHSDFCLWYHQYMYLYIFKLSIKGWIAAFCAFRSLQRKKTAPFLFCVQQACKNINKPSHLTSPDNDLLHSHMSSIARYKYLDYEVGRKKLGQQFNQCVHTCSYLGWCLENWRVVVHVWRGYTDAECTL